MSESLRAVKGMNDLLPPESGHWAWFEAAVHRVMHRHGYAQVRTPIVEPTALFVRGLGEVTDIVEKEMYSFTDSMNGDALSLRPEGTAGVVRAAIEHSLLHDGPARLYYIGPMFRHERPQKGRSRQFHQVGVEALGCAGPDVDAEQILLLRQLWRELGLDPDKHLRLDLNCLGQAEERRAHREALIAHFAPHPELLDADAARRLHRNPLRLLDSKHAPMQGLIEAAPRLLDVLGADSRAHFDGVRRLLDDAGLAYRVNPRLVRGMDYYNLTVFEWIAEQGLGAQNTVCGGGRYDGLMQLLGGKPAPAVGWGMGIERLLLLLDERGLAPSPARPDVYAIVPEAAAMSDALRLADQLRSTGLAVVVHAATAQGLSSLKAQLRRADQSGANHALIFGASERAQGMVAVKALRESAAEQVLRPLADALLWAESLRNR